MAQVHLIVEKPPPNNTLARTVLVSMFPCLWLQTRQIGHRLYKQRQMGYIDYRTRGSHPIHSHASGLTNTTLVVPITLFLSESSQRSNWM